MGKFLVFLSSEDEDVLVKNESIKLFLNNLAPKGCSIEFIKKHENILMAKADMDYFKGSSIYLVDIFNMKTMESQTLLKFIESLKEVNKGRDIYFNQFLEALNAKLEGKEYDISGLPISLEQEFNRF